MMRLGRNSTYNFLESIESRIQREFNSIRMGPYMGPYDPNKVLILSSHLTKSDVDFNNRNQFINSEHFKFKSISIKESYEKFDEISKK